MNVGQSGGGRDPDAGHLHGRRHRRKPAPSSWPASRSDAFSTPADIAAAAVYLCSQEASMVTGGAMEVDGGRCI